MLIAGCGGGSPPAATSGAKPQAIWGEPLNGRPAKGLLILIHGGAWSGLSRKALRSEVALSPIFRRLGFATLSVDYRQGAEGISDVEHFYRQARRRVGPHLPICAYGVSAGGHIALMLAVRNPDMACVIDVAGPTDLETLARQPGGQTGYGIAESAFGSGLLASLSPAQHAGSIRAKLLLVYAGDDRLVPVEQGVEMHHAVPGSELIVLPPGRAPFVHTGIGAPVAKTGVDAAAKARAGVREVGFLEQVAATWHGG